MFTGLFADAIHGTGLRDGVLRRDLLRCGGPEHGDATRPVHPFQPPFPRQFEHDEKALHVEFPRKCRVLLGGGAQQSSKQIDLIDPILIDDPFDTSAIHGVDHGEGPGLFRLGLLDVAGDHVIMTETGAKPLNEFGADLAGGADDEYLLHERRPKVDMRMATLQRHMRQEVLLKTMRTQEPNDVRTFSLAEIFPWRTSVQYHHTLAFEDHMGS